MGNPFVHVELNSADIAASKAFYGALFDWRLHDQDMGGPSPYTMIEVGEGTEGGMMQHPMPGAPSIWISYVLVPDIRAATAKAKELGATLIQDCREVPNTGWLSIFRDPTGAVLGLWQQAGR